MINYIKHVIENIDINSFLAYLATLLSLICAIMPIFVGSTTISIVTGVIGILCFIILLYYLYTITNKSRVLQLLSDTNRSQALRLLLTYESTKCHNNSDGEIFKSGNLHISHATYKYTVKKNESPDGPFDLQCTWTFELKKTCKSDSISFLISQPRGIETHTITYKINDKSFKKRVRAVPLNNHSDFKGFLQCTIPSQQNLNKLSIEFTMEKAYQAKANGAFLTCPFFFAKSIDELFIQCDYQDVREMMESISFSLLFYPYDGRKCKVQNIGNFVREGNEYVWNCSVLPKFICTQAIYVTEIFHR